jgi:hypothetical protein
MASCVTGLEGSGALNIGNLDIKSGYDEVANHFFDDKDTNDNKISLSLRISHSSHS